MVFKYSLIFKIKCLISTGAFFESRGNFDIPFSFEIEKYDILPISKVLETRIWGHKARVRGHTVTKTVLFSTYTFQALTRQAKQATKLISTGFL